MNLKFCCLIKIPERAIDNTWKLSNSSRTVYQDCRLQILRDEAETRCDDGDGQTLLLVPGPGLAPGDRPQCPGSRHLPLRLQSEDLTP